MAPLNRPADDAPNGEWLYQAQGQVFGPFSAARIAELISAGDLAATSRISGPDGGWRPLGSVPAFLVLVCKAEAKARVEADAARLRRRATLRRTAKVGGLALGLAVLVALVGGLAWLLAMPSARPAPRRDLGDEIAVGAIRIATQPTRIPDESAAPERRPGDPDTSSRNGAARPNHASRPVATASRTSRDHAPRSGPGGRPMGTAEGGDLVIAQYDVKRVQEAVARQQGTLAPCLQEEARRTPEFSGELPIEFAVGNDGRVAALWIQDPRFKSGALHECLLRTLREWSFDPFPGQRPVVSLAFRVGVR